MMHEAGVYIHIPFCATKCSYCDFLSFSGMEQIYDSYVDVLLSEIRSANIISVSTVYIGGGTPTVLPVNLMQNVLACISDLPLVNDAEITIEVNPGTVNLDYLQLIKSAGINRISFGLQSTCNNLLASIGRIHSYELFLENYLSAQDVGFDNINVDLIFGLPGQTTVTFEQTLSMILDLEPQHVSFYSLTLCENTPLWNDICLGKISLPDDEVDRSMYHFASKFFGKNGYVHYEISNAAKPGFECSHNLDCWRHKPYIGFGLGAHSFDGQKRWSNPSTFADYFSFKEPKFELLSDDQLISESMILGLRLLDGVDESLFESRYRVRPSVFFDGQISKLVSDGLLELSNNRVRLTSLGLDLANQVFMQFL